MIKDEEYNDLDFEDEERVELDFGEIVRVKGNGIESITVDDNYIFTINYTDGTSQTIPTTYRDFKNVLDQLTAANTDAKKQIVDISQKISEADEKKVEVAEYADKAKTASDQAVSSAADAAKSAESAATSEAKAKDSAASALTSANNAKTSETNSAASESNASGYASAADKSAKDAASSATSASSYASSANTSAENAAASAKSASDSASAASTSANNAASAETNSAKSASDAAASAENAATSETNAGKSAKSAADSASEAAEYAKQAGATIEATKSAEQAKISETNASASADSAANSAESAQNALSEIESKGQNILTSTLSASGWTGTEAPYQYDLSTIASFKACTIGFDSSTGTDEQLKAAQSANIHGGSGTSIYAYGTKPDTDIPIVIEQSNFGTATGIVASFSGGGGGDGGFSIVQVPEVSGTSFAYTGSAQGPTITGLDTTKVTVTNATATNVGTYTLKIALKDKTKSMWSDATTDDKTYQYTIVPISVIAPTVVVGEYTYNGSEQGPAITNSDTAHITVTGATATNAGSYTVTATLKDKTCMTWIDGTTADKTWNYTIQKAAQAITLSESSVELNTSALSKTVTVSGNSGALTVSSDNTAVASASISGSTITITATKKTGTANVTVTAAETSNYKQASMAIKATAKFTSIYGVSWDGTSTTAWTRTDEAANFTDPVPYVKGATSYSSPFDNLMPWSGMQRVSDTEAGELVKIPKFWYKITQSGSGLKIQIADGEEDGFNVSPAHMDRGDGKGERDVVYIGRYHCSSSDYKSTTRKSPKVNITRSTARSSISNLGATIWQSDFAMRFTIWLLYIVEFANWNSQAKIGYGCGNNPGTQSCGASDSMPYHTGTMQSSRTTYGVGVQYRYIEGLWDNCLDWMDGCYNNSNGLNVILNPSKFSDGSNGTSVGTPSSGYPSAFKLKETSGLFPCIIPTSASGSESTYSCDYWYFSSSDPCLYVGGYYGQSLGYGLFFFYCGDASNSSSSVGCRLQKLP